MDKATNGPFVPPSALDALKQQAAEVGLSAESLAAELGLHLSGSTGGLRVALVDYLRLQARLTSELKDETCRMSKRQLLSGSTELALSRLPSRGGLIDAMHTVARSYNLLHGGEFNAVEMRGDLVAFVIDDRDFPYAVDQTEQILFLMETTLLFVHALLRLIVPSVAAGSWRNVELRRPSPPARVPFEKHVSVRYGTQRYALLYDARSASRVVTFPPPGAITLDAVTSEQLGLLEDGLDDRTFSGRVRLLIEEGAADQTAVAQALGMSVATLRRRLVDEGASFRALRMRALTEQAERLLRTDLPLAQVAERLGFSDVRSFSRAFKAWTGVTPNVRRRSAHN